MRCGLRSVSLLGCEERGLSFEARRRRIRRVSGDDVVGEDEDENARGWEQGMKRSVAGRAHAALGPSALSDERRPSRQVGVVAMRIAHAAAVNRCISRRPSRVTRQRHRPHKSANSPCAVPRRALGSSWTEPQQR